MLQDIPTPTLHEPSSCVLETERLTLRRPTLADVKAIARLANDRRIAENTRRLPHPYSPDHAIEFVRATANDRPETVFLIESNFVPIGMVGVDWREPDAPELGYWLGVKYWGQGFGTEAARAVNVPVVALKLGSGGVLVGEGDEVEPPAGEQADRRRESW